MTIDRVATANIKATLDDDKAALALERSTIGGLAGELEVEAVGLQEWPRRRRKLERSVERRSPFVFRRPRFGGGGPIGLVDTRYVPTRVRSYRLARAGRVDRSPGRRRFLGASRATVVRAIDAIRDERVTFVNYHLTAEVQRGDSYRDDRPLRVRRHRREVRRLERLIRRERRRGRTVYALGDSNYHGLRLDGVTSAWTGRLESRPGTRGGRRKIDDVHGPGRALEVDLVDTPSDHRTVIVTRRR